MKEMLPIELDDEAKKQLCYFTEKLECCESHVIERALRFMYFLDIMHGGGVTLMTEKDSKPMTVELDKATELWFKHNPGAQSTVVQCEHCGLYYKPSLGHACKGRRKNG